MAVGIKIVGLENALRQMQMEIDRVKRVTKKSLIKAGLLIQRSAQKKTPVDTGNLKASAFTMWGSKPALTGPRFKDAGKEKGRMIRDHMTVTSESRARTTLGSRKGSPKVEVGFSAYYALFVHEDTQASHVAERRKRRGKVRRRGKNLVKAAVTGRVTANNVMQTGEAKFLEKAVYEVTPLISLIFKAEDVKTGI